MCVFCELVNVPCLPFVCLYLLKQSGIGLPKRSYCTWIGDDLESIFICRERDHLSAIRLQGNLFQMTLAPDDFPLRSYCSPPPFPLMQKSLNLFSWSPYCSPSFWSTIGLISTETFQFYKVNFVQHLKAHRFRKNRVKRTRWGLTQSNGDTWKQVGNCVNHHQKQPNRLNNNMESFPWWCSWMFMCIEQWFIIILSECHLTFCLSVWEIIFYFAAFYLSGL